MHECATPGWFSTVTPVSDWKFATSHGGSVFVADGLLFGLAHFEPLQFAGLAAFGVVLAVLAWRTGRLIYTDAELAMVVADLVDPRDGKPNRTRTRHQLGFARGMSPDAQDTAVAEQRDGGGAPLLQGTSFPGFMIPFGSKSCLMPR